MKYFSTKGIDYHCSDIFNWMAIDKDGSVYLYQNKPFLRLECGYWTSGHTDSYDYHLYTDPTLKCPNWLNTLVHL